MHAPMFERNSARDQCRSVMVSGGWARNALIYTHTRRLSCSLPGAPLRGRMSCMLAPLAASPAALALLVSSPAACSARRLACRSLRSPLAAGRSACSSLRSHLLVLLTASLALPASPAPAFLARAPDPVRLSESLSGSRFSGKPDPDHHGGSYCGIPRTFYPTGELPPGEDCVFRRPPVVNIYGMLAHILLVTPGVVPPQL